MLAINVNIFNYSKGRDTVWSRLVTPYHSPSPPFLLRHAEHGVLVGIFFTFSQISRVVRRICDRSAAIDADQLIVLFTFYIYI
jgi:hypothetical protein